MKKATILLVSALLASGTVATAADSDTSGSQDAQKEKRICKSEKITGSLTRVRRTCYTQREWDRLAEIARRENDLITRDANQKYADGVANRDLYASLPQGNPVP